MSDISEIPKAYVTWKGFMKLVLHLGHVSSFNHAWNKDILTVNMVLKNGLTASMSRSYEDLYKEMARTRRNTDLLDRYPQILMEKHLYKRLVDECRKMGIIGW